MEISTKKTDDIGISFDFKKLKSITESILSNLDHKHINDIEPFNKINPTAENLSTYLYTRIKKQLPPEVDMSKITVWESDNYAVTYTDE